MGADLLLKYLIILLAAHIACAWIQAFQTPWPLADAFELADTVEEQLFRSLGIRFDELIAVPAIVNDVNRVRATLTYVFRTCTIDLLIDVRTKLVACRQTTANRLLHAHFDAP